MSCPNWLLPPIESLTVFPIDKIAQQLSRICRYAGATPHFYSVARHSLLVADLIGDDPELRLAGLVHDAHECWIGDMLLPAKEVVGDALEHLSAYYDERIHAMVGVRLGDFSRTLVAAADKTACHLEMEWLGKSSDIIAFARFKYEAQNKHLTAEYTQAADAMLWACAVDQCRKDMKGAT